MTKILDDRQRKKVVMFFPCRVLESERENESDLGWIQQNGNKLTNNNLR